MKKIIAAIAVFIVAYTLFLIANVPASLTTKWVEIPKNISINQLSGTIWNGTAEQIHINDVAISDITFALNPLSVALLAPELTTTFGGGLSDGPEGKANAIISGDKIELVDTQLAVSASVIAPYINSPVPVEAMGLVTINITQLDYQQGKCSVAEGDVKWRNAAVSAFDQSVELGNFTGTLTCKNQLLTLTIDPKNNLGLSFSGQLTNNRIAGRGYVKPGQNFPAKLRDLLSFVGKPDNQGRYLIQL